MRKGNIVLNTLMLAFFLGLIVSGGSVSAHGPGDRLGHSHGHGHHGHKEDKKDKAGILLVAFGSSYPQAQAAFDSIEDQVEETFPKIPVRWAYTSKMVRKKLGKKGKDLDSPIQALADMLDEGFTHVAVQSLHTIAGAEFHELQSVVNAFEAMDRFERIMLGYPLLSTPHSLEHVRRALLNNIPKERSKDEAVIFMGHGTYHPSNAFYQAMAYELQQKDSNVYMGTIGGSLSLDTILPELKEKGIEKAYLLPFMAVAGDHVRNDMAGDGKNSWKSVLEESGIECEPVLKGTAEYDNLAGIWVMHLKDVMEHYK